MAEQADEKNIDSQAPVGHEVVPEAGTELETHNTRSAYLKFINYARIAVAIAMAICGAGSVIFINRYEYFKYTLRREPGIWTWGALAFAIGVYACLIATLALIIEYVARPVAPRQITLRAIFLRSLFIIIAIAAIDYSMFIFFGIWQAIIATIGILMLLAALKWALET
jgi:hypothetical protein